MDTSARILFLSREGSLAALARLAQERGDDVTYYQQIGRDEGVTTYRKWLDWPEYVVTDDPHYYLRRGLFTDTVRHIGPVLDNRAWRNFAGALRFGIEPGDSWSDIVIVPMSHGRVSGPATSYQGRRTKEVRLVQAALSNLVGAPYPETHTGLLALAVKRHKNTIYLLADLPDIGYRVLTQRLRCTNESLSSLLSRLWEGSQVDLRKPGFWRAGS